MLGVFKKSPETVASGLFSLSTEIGSLIGSENFLNFPKPSIEHARYLVSTHLFTILLCQEIVLWFEKDKMRSLEICGSLTNKMIDRFANGVPTPPSLTDFVVCDEELQWMRRHIAECRNETDFSQVRLPLAEIVGELYAVRTMKMTTDLTEGAMIFSQQGPWSLGLLMPVCSSLVLQTTGDESLANNRQIVTELAASLSAKFLWLHEETKAALT